MTRVIKINTSANPAFISVNDDGPVGGGGATVYTNFASFPAPPAAGNPQQSFAIDASNGLLYCSFGGSWCAVSILSP